MHVALGADHAGVGLKDAVKAHLASRGITVSDVGTHGHGSVDYPDFAREVARAVRDGQADRGVLVCGSGIGMAIAANKVAGIRAAAIGDVTSAQLAREHNDLNVLALGARLTPPETALAVLDAFLDTPFAGGRHEQRVAKIHADEVS